MEVTIEASYWVALEKTEEVNHAVARFSEAKLPKVWPGRGDLLVTVGAMMLSFRRQC